MPQKGKQKCVIMPLFYVQHAAGARDGGGGRSNYNNSGKKSAKRPLYHNNNNRQLSSLPVHPTSGFAEERFTRKVGGGGVVGFLD